jgi:hypothetical protein
MSETATPQELSALVAMTTAAPPSGALSRDTQALLTKATEQARRAVQRAALTVRTRVRSMDDLAGLRVLVQAVVNLQRPLAAHRSPPNAAPFDADAAVRHLAAGAADLPKRVQQVLLALHKAELKLAHALAFLRAPDAALSHEPERLVAIGTLARAVLSEFSSCAQGDARQAALVLIRHRLVVRFVVRYCSASSASGVAGGCR